MASQQQALERDAIGLTEVLFQSITHMAPAVAVALSIGFATSLAGGNTPLAVLLALIAVLFTAYGIGELARHLPSAGGMYTYVGRGLGSYAGWLMAWAFLLAEPIVPPVLFAAFGFYGAALLTELFGISGDLLWVPIAILSAAIVWFLTYRGITFSTRTGVVLGLIEISIFLFVSTLLVINADNTLSVFVPGDDGIKPALQGMVFCLLAFVGFEAAAPLAEETRDPKRTIRQAVLWSAILIGLFYVFNYYAATVFFGPGNMADFIGANEGNPWGGMANQVLPGIGNLLVIFAILNSCLANANSGANASTRAIFALGRSRLLPNAFAAVHLTHRTPVNAVHFQGILGIVIAVGLGLYFGSAFPDTPGPLNVYFVLGYALGLLFAGMYIAVNVAVIGYYWRVQRDEFNWLKHVVVPVVGVILMIPAFVSVIGGVTIPIIDLELSALTEPYAWAPLFVAVWMIAGIVIGLYFRTSRAEALKTVGLAMGEGTEPEPPAAPSAAPTVGRRVEVLDAPTIHVARGQNHLAWDPAIPPIATVSSGSIVEFDCLDASFGQLTADSTTADLANLDFSRVDQVNGPVAVEGAEAGDTLQIDILELAPADWGWTASIPGFGLLADDFPDPFYKVTAVPGATGRAEYWPGVNVPLAPFCGEMGIAPASGPLSTIPPDVHGGNMDTRHLVAGSSLFLPVFVAGARFSIGDGHATQGDGEVCGTAIETPMRALVRLSVRKDVRVTGPEFLAAPDPNRELRSGRRYATDGIGPDLMTAARDAVRRMLDWLGREHGLSPIEAYLLCSVAIDLRISEIVDVPNFVVTVHCPLGIFD